MAKDSAKQATQLARIKASIKHLIESEEIPGQIRHEMKEEFQALVKMLEKLEEGELFIAAIGKVGVGKSALLNALSGEHIFEVGVLNGVTKAWEKAQFQLENAPKEIDGVKLDERVVLIDTPGFMEAGEEGMTREAISMNAARAADIILFVADSDLTAPEAKLLQALLALVKPMIVVLNKVDRLTPEERQEVKTAIASYIPESYFAYWSDDSDDSSIVETSADPMPVTVEKRFDDGRIETTKRKPEIEITKLKASILHVLEREKLDLLIYNSAMFSAEFSDDISKKVVETRQALSERMLRYFAVAKGLAVAVNPIPVADVLGAFAVDSAMILALAKLHAMPMTWTAAQELAVSISKQMAIFVSVEAATHVVAGLLKGMTFGLSTAVTALPQGMIAAYNSYIIGQAALHYFEEGFSWGKKGAKQVVKEILDTVDKESFVQTMKAEIQAKLKKKRQTD